LSEVSEKSPIAPYISGSGKDSLLSVAKESSKQTLASTGKYTASVIDYCVEWEQIVSTRIDEGLAENRKKYERLDHYQNKVEKLRKQSNRKMEQHQQKEEKKSTAAAAAAGSSSTKSVTTTTTTSPSEAVPKRLADKLTRNESKLDMAWKSHERNSTELCNLMEEATAQGWNDLYPLVQNLIRWEINRASKDYDAMAELAVVQEKLGKTVASEQAKRMEKVRQHAAAAAGGGNNDEESETNWSSHSSSTASTTEAKK